MLVCHTYIAGKPNPNNAVVIIRDDGYLASVRVDHWEGLNHSGKRNNGVEREQIK